MTWYFIGLAMGTGFGWFIGKRDSFKTYLFSIQIHVLMIREFMGNDYFEKFGSYVQCIEQRDIQRIYDSNRELVSQWNKDFK